MENKTNKTPAFASFSCPGEAHRSDVNGMIDNCNRCAPFWGVIILPGRFGSLDSWADAWDVAVSTGGKAISALRRERNKAQKAYVDMIEGTR